MFLTRQEAAEVLTKECRVPTKPQALADMACDDEGPAYTVIRKRALYRREDLAAWVKAEAAKHRRDPSATRSAPGSRRR